MTLIKYLIVLITLISLSNCGNETENTSNQKHENDKHQEVVESQDVPMEESVEEVEHTPHSPDPQTFKGFIGNSAITAELDFNWDQGTIDGYYYYDEYKKNITLHGEQVEWYCGPIYKLIETNEDSIKTGEWLGMNDCTFYLFTGTFSSNDGKTNLEIILKNEETELYLDPQSKIIFDDKTHADNFFLTHHFLNNEVRNKKGIIMENNEKYHQLLLPEGTTLYEHDGGDGFGAAAFGKIDNNGDMQLDNGETISLYDFGEYETTRYQSETDALRFDEVIDNEFISIRGKEYNDIYISIDELAKNGYHLEGDGYWIKKMSHNVLGFFPDYWYDIKGEITHPIVNIYEKRDTKSKSLFKTSSDSEGYFSLNDVVFFNNEYWANVTFDFHTQVPCSDEVRPAKQSITGWTPLYQDRKLVFGFYSGGC